MQNMYCSGEWERFSQSSLFHVEPIHYWYTDSCHKTLFSSSTINCKFSWQEAPPGWAKTIQAFSKKKVTEFKHSLLSTSKQIMGTLYSTVEVTACMNLHAALTIMSIA
jgi:hypothetical protein